MALAELTAPGLIFPDVTGADGVTVLRDLAERMRVPGQIADSNSLFDKLWEREHLGSTGIGQGVAIPHCKLSGLKQVVLAIGIARQGVDFDAVDGKPVCLFFVVVSPSRSAAQHLQSLAAISKWVKSGDHVEQVLELTDPEAIFELLKSGEE